MAARLGVLAGAGELPRRVIEAAHALQRPVFVVGFEGIADPATVEREPHMWARLGAAGAVIDRLRQEGVSDICMVGAVRRPSLASLRPDWRAAKLIANIGFKSLGDDGLLRAVIGMLEEEGFHVVSVETLLAEALAPQGAFGRIAPDGVASADIARGLAVAKALGAHDIGQAVVVQQGMVLGVEAIEGTDALLARVALLGRDGPGGVLVKIAKPGQDRRADLPTIGPHTIAAVAAAGLRGIAIEAGSTLVVDRAALIAAADEAGLFVVGVAAP